MHRIREEGAARVIAAAKAADMPIIVVSGRPYHLAPEINHGIDKLICNHGAALVSEDSIAYLAGRQKVAGAQSVDLPQPAVCRSGLRRRSPRDDIWYSWSVFGCGVDAITTDEVKAILQEKGRIYTQIKIDEITNLGAVNIRIRSLLAAIGR